MAPRIGIIGLLLAWALPQAVTAQDPSERPRFELVGVVTDVGTEAPVAGATVSVVELNRQVVTDEAGRFRIPDVLEGRWTFRTEAFGYFENVERSVVSDGYALTVGLAPAPFELEGLDVVTQTTGVADNALLAVLDRRFQARTSRVGVSSDVTPRRRLESTTAPSVLELLADEYGVRPVECPSLVAIGPPDLDCFYVRGQARRMTVFVDDIDVSSPAFTLDAYRPIDLYRVEWYDTVGQVRLYTHAYAMTLARTGRPPAPVCLVC